MTQTQGRYVVVDTTLSITDSTPIKELNGRQGDNGRIVYFALKDGRLPHNLDGQDVALEVKDAAGKIKVVNGIYDMVSATAGLFSMLIPAEVYQAAGDVEEAYLVVKDDKATVISSIPITFTVFANGIILSANASQHYIDTIQKVIDEFNKKIGITSASLETQENALKTLTSTLENINNQINTAQLAGVNVQNTFKELQHFDGGATLNGKDIALENETVHLKGNEVIDDVKEFKNDIKGNVLGITKSIPIDYNSDTFTGKTPIYITTKNGIASLEVNISFLKETSSQAIIAQIPEGLRPANNVFDASSLFNSRKEYPEIVIEKGGRFYVGSGQPTSTYIRKTLTYILA